MAILEADIEYRYSNPAASAGNELAQASAAASLGGYVSRTFCPAATLHSIFAAMSGDDNVGLRSEYRCIFVLNRHTSLTWTNVVVWLSTMTAGGALEAVGVDPVAASALGSTSAQARVVTDRYSAPANVSFSAPTSKPAGLALGNIPPGHCKAFWLRRTGNNTAAVAGEPLGWRCEGDTEA